MPERRSKDRFLRASALGALILGPVGSSQAGGLHGKLGGHIGTLGSTPALVVGVAPTTTTTTLGVVQQPVTTLGVAPSPTATLGVGYSLVPATTAPTTAPASLGAAYTYTIAPAPTATLGAAPTVLGLSPQPVAPATYPYQIVGYGVPTAASGPAAGANQALGAGRTADPEVQLGAALGSGNLQRMKDHLEQVLDDELSAGSKPRRRALIRLLSDAALEFGRDELHLDLIHWLPVVRNLVTSLIDDHEADAPNAPAPARTTDSAPSPPTLPGEGSDAPATPSGTPATPAPRNGQRVIPVQARGYLVIDRIEINGQAVTPTVAPAPAPTPTPAPAPAPSTDPAPTTPAEPSTPVTPARPAPAQPDPQAAPSTPPPPAPALPAGDETPRDTGPLLPGEGNEP